ncbi:WPP domain-interacting protein 1-like isoform X1 [Lycium barbarum]|uniref:WPP domain-interacting protein 1-like isoform X1 n=2 Tax=Lycium barbarum TaxID=112863 RepID=UPI00293EF99F|nr:WPP domain-interacting protein 1-like isoform X1 [Lycium barbarum]
MTEKDSNHSVSNYTNGGRSMNHDGELNDETQDRERAVGEELQADLDRRNDGEVGGVSQEDLAAESPQEAEKEKSENHCSSADHDPMLDSLSTLQALQEALERELWSFREIKKEDSITISNSCSKKEEKSVGIALHRRTSDLESEVEALFRQKIEAEVEYLTVSRAVKKLRVAAVEQVNLLEEQKKLASEQAQIVKKLGEAELKAATLKTQATKFENCGEDIMTIDEMLKLQKRVCKYSTCFLLQLVLLVVVGLFLLQISPDYAEVVPT